MGDPGDTLRIVFICTGNQARSVLAEHYVRKIAAGLPLTTESVGVLDVGGAAALPGAVAAGEELGLDLSDHASRPFGTVDLASADLVIGFEHHHVAAAVVDGNASPAKTFKLAELVRLLAQGGAPGGDSARSARQAIETAATRRASDPDFRPGEDIADPIGQDASFFRETAAEIQEACDRVLWLLFPHK